MGLEPTIFILFAPFLRFVALRCIVALHCVALVALHLIALRCAGTPDRHPAMQRNVTKPPHRRRLNATSPSGGSVIVSMYGRPWHDTGAASTPPKFPWPLPPYIRASLFRIS